MMEETYPRSFISRHGIIYHFSIWAETHTRVEMLPEVVKGDPGVVEQEIKEQSSLLPRGP